MMSIVLPALLGHVRMLYMDGVTPGPIRNAGSATGDGRGSVAGACGGGGLAFGANGIGTVTDGQQVTLNINYAAGHASAQNAFRFVLACSAGTTPDAAVTQNGVEGQATVLTAADNGCTATSAGAAAAYDGQTGVAAPQAIVPGGYSVTCTLPSQGGARACTMSLLDQRDWGGCVDVNMLAAGDPLPPSPPPAPIVPSTGSYPFNRENLVDSSASTFTCCPLDGGYLTVPTYAIGAPSFTATMTSVLASCCRTSADIEAPVTASHEIDESIIFTQSGTGNKYKATTQVGGAWGGQVRA